MKNLVVIFQVLFVSINISNCQIITLVGEFFDKTSGVFNNDTVVFGFDVRATTGIDEFLEEKDLFSSPLMKHDLRIIQRSEKDWNCLFDTAKNPIYFDITQSSKVDLRSISSIGKDCYFELQFSSDFTFYRSLLSEYGNPKLKQRYLAYKQHLECELKDEWNDISNRSNGDTAFANQLIIFSTAFDGDSIKYVFFHLQPNLKLSIYDGNKNLIKKVNLLIKDRLPLPSEGKSEIYNVLGQRVLSHVHLPPEDYIYIGNLTSGYYILMTFDSSGRFVNKTRFTKL